MRQVMVRYKVKPERVEENEDLVRAVYDEIRRAEPAGLRYATFKLDDGVSFVHLAVTESENGGSPLSKVKAFQEFQKDIEDRTDEGPVVTELDLIGSFRLLGDSREH
jgi:quinol monooxygenase YgiN